MHNECIHECIIHNECIHECIIHVHYYYHYLLEKTSKLAFFWLASTLSMITYSWKRTASASQTLWQGKGWDGDEAGEEHCVTPNKTTLRTWTIHGCQFTAQRRNWPRARCNRIGCNLTRLQVGLELLNQLITREKHRCRWLIWEGQDPVCECFNQTISPEQN